MTKPIIAIVTMQLVEKKLINLDDPIDKYLTEFQNLKVMKRPGMGIFGIFKILKIFIFLRTMEILKIH